MAGLHVSHRTLPSIEREVRVAIERRQETARGKLEVAALEVNDGLRRLLPGRASAQATSAGSYSPPITRSTSRPTV
jgi:hypothetical protein